MSAPTYTVSNAARQMREEPRERKASECDKNQEIEKIKRQLAQLIDRVDSLKKA